MKERVAAWYVTGPLGHLVAGIADWVQLLGRYGMQRLKDAAARRAATGRARP